jgi:hypothetical protein
MLDVTFEISAVSIFASLLEVPLFAPYSSLTAFLWLGVIDSLSRSKSSLYAILGLLSSAVLFAKEMLLIDRLLALLDKLLEVDQRLGELLQARLQLVGLLLLL